MLLFVSKVIGNITHNFTQVYKIFTGYHDASMKICYPEERVIACGANITLETFCTNPLRMFYDYRCKYGDRNQLRYQEQITQCDAVNPLDINTSKCLEDIFNCCKYREPFEYSPLILVIIFGFSAVMSFICGVYYLGVSEDLERSANSLPPEVPSEEIMASLRARGY